MLYFLFSRGFPRLFWRPLAQTSPNRMQAAAEPFFGDLGYSLPLPWPQVTTAGYLDGGNDNFQGGETPAPSNRLPSENKKLITSNEPEYYATNNRINQLGGIPEIDVRDPKYSFRRANHIIQI